MYRIPIKVNKRDFVLRLEEEKSMNTSPQASFVVDNTELFRFHTPQKVMSYNMGCEEDFEVHIKSIDYKSSDKGENELLIRIGTEDVPASDMKVNLQKAGIKRKPDGSFIHSRGYNKIKILKIYVLLEINSESFTGLFVLSMGAKEAIVDVVLDFGSEASQILYKFRSDENFNLNQITSIFQQVKSRYGASELRKIPHDNGNETELDIQERVKKHLGYSEEDADIEEMEDDIFLQHDDSRKLYKSVYYISDELENKDFHQIAGEPSAMNSFVFLNRGQDIPALEKDGYFLLPNLKVAYFGGVELPDLKNNVNIYNYLSQCRRAVMNFLIRQVLDIIYNLDDLQKLVNLIVLVPNSYMHSDIAKLLKGLEEDMHVLLSASEYENVFLPYGYQISTFSESDASFLGSTSGANISLKDGEFYLTIDIGKGTTDFSIVRIFEKDNIMNAERIYRSGYIGAGNVVSFSLFANILAHVFYALSPEKYSDNKLLFKDIRKYVKLIVNGMKSSSGNSVVDRSDLVLLVHIVEKYKQKVGEWRRRYNQDNPQKELKKIDLTREDMNFSDGEFPEDISKLALSRVLDGIKYYTDSEGFAELSDRWEIIENALKQLCSRFSNNISEWKETFKKPIDKVIISGRGSRYDDLKQKLQNEIGRLFVLDANSFLDIDPDSGDAKNICMFGPLKHSPVFDNSVDSMGWPYSSCVIPEEIKPVIPAQEEGEQKKKQKINRLFSIKDVILQLSDPETAKLKPDTVEEINETGDDAAPEKSQKENYGTLTYKKIVVGLDDFVVIGGRKYKIKHEGEKENEYLVFYDGEKFVPRTMTNSYEFVPENSQLNSDFVFETLFPFASISGQHEELSLQLIPIHGFTGNVSFASQTEQNAENKTDADEMNEKKRKRSGGNFDFEGKGA